MRDCPGFQLMYKGTNNHPRLETGEGEDYDGSQMNLIKVDLIIIYLMIQPNLALQAKHKIVK